MTNSIANSLQQGPAGTAVVSAGRLRLNSIADSALRKAARLWFLVAVTGQWIFVYYIVSVYGGPAVRGDWEAWSAHAQGQYVPGDTLGNLAFAMHVLLAIIVIGGGPLQLIPQIRTYAPRFHHWNGRVYMLTVFIASIAGLFILWTRGTVGNLVLHIGTSLDGVLIMVFAVVALRYAIARDIETHRRWALRLFMVVNAVWFFRIGLMLWVFLNGGPVGFDPETFTGPFLYFMAFAQYLLPLAILEIYLRTRDGAGAPGRLAMASALLVLTALTGGGIFAATMGMWLPGL